MDETQELAQLRTLKEKIPRIRFEIEKAEFNDLPTTQLEAELSSNTSQLINLLSTVLERYLPIQLSPLHLDRQNREINLPLVLNAIIEDIGLDDSDHKLLLKLQGDNPKHHKLLLLLGSYYIARRQADQATGYYQEISSERYSDLIHYNLSYCLAVQKILTPALQHLHQISSSFPQDLILLNTLVIFDKLGRFEEVSQAFSSIPDNSPYHNLALFNYGVSALGFGKLDLASDILKQLLQKDPGFPRLHFILGQLAAQQGVYSDAIAAFEIAHRDNAENLEILSDLGTAYLLAGRFHDAIDYYLKYLQLDQSLSIYNNLGAAYLKIEEYQKAVDILDKALQLNPDHKQSLKNRAVAQSFLN